MRRRRCSSPTEMGNGLLRCALRTPLYNPLRQLRSRVAKRFGRFPQLEESRGSYHRPPYNRPIDHHMGSIVSFAIVSARG